MRGQPITTERLATGWGIFISLFILCLFMCFVAVWNVRILLILYPPLSLFFQQLLWD